MKAALLYASLGLSLLACKKAEAPTGVAIRVRNASTEPFDALLVDTSGGEQAYGPVGAGQRSDYRSFTRAYAYAYLRVTVRGQDLVWQPIDYVGQQPLSAGQYTYVVDVVRNTSTGTSSLYLQLERP